MERFSTISKKELFDKLSSSPEGLTQQEATKRLETFGENKLEKKEKGKLLKTIVEQFHSSLIYILLIAAVVSFLIHHAVDGIVILIIVLVNAAIGFFQQYKAEQSLEQLKKLLVPQTKVLREGKVHQLPSPQLVPGDVILLEEGDKVPADARIIQVEDVAVNEAILTGESYSVVKTDTVLSQQAPLAEQKNMLFSGTQVVRGRCQAMVVSTGMKTAMGSLAETLQTITHERTPIQKRLDVFSRQLGMVILGLIGVLFILGVWRGNDISLMLLTAVTLAVGAIPEGLPAVLTIGFAVSSLALSKRNVIIRKLPAVEALGSVTVICTDKTGTLTEENIRVHSVHLAGQDYTIDKSFSVPPRAQKDFSFLLATSVLCNNARYERNGKKVEYVGDPTEKALVSFALDQEVDKKVLTEHHKKVKEFAFTSQRMMMSMVRKDGRDEMLHTKGAAERVLALCTHELVNGKKQRLTPQRRKELEKVSESMEERGLRVLGFAQARVLKKPQEKDLVFLGLIGMIDPPRKEVPAAIKECLEAGIQVKIITGDSLPTARTIAEQIGVKGEAIHGKDLEKMSDPELLRSIDKIGVFARTTPQQKLRISQLLHQRGEVVAITGDGVNDVLALKSADIGVSMGVRGSDVARDVSDMVLLDDNFASIVEGVRQGRKTYDNIKKFTTYMLTVNFDTIILIGAISLMGLPLPILPLQILWKNLVTDSLPAISLILEPEENVMQSSPRRDKSILSGSWRFIILGGLLNLMATAIAYAYGYLSGMPIDQIRTMVVSTDIIYELLFVFVCRSKKPFTLSFKRNPLMYYSVIGAFLLHLLLVYFPPLASLFSFTPLSLWLWVVVLALSASGYLLFELKKVFSHQQARREGKA